VRLKSVLSILLTLEQKEDYLSVATDLLDFTEFNEWDITWKTHLKEKFTPTSQIVLKFGMHIGPLPAHLLVFLLLSVRPFLTCLQHFFFNNSFEHALRKTLRSSL
jgi:hypothetical protein